MTPYRAVVFDYFGTLTPSVPVGFGVRGTLDRIAAALGITEQGLTEGLNATFGDRFLGTTGTLTETLRMLARRAGGEPDEAGLAEARRIRTEAYVRGATPRPDAVAVVRALRDAGLRVGLISDCSAELVELWPGLPLADLVESPVFSAVVGLRKPDPRIYRLAHTALGVAPGDCLYVGDGGSGELTGAAAARLRPVQLRDEGWETGFRSDPDDWRGAQISRLAEVLDLVAAAR